MKDFSEINDLVKSVECRMQDAYEQGYETGHKYGEASGINKMNYLSKKAYEKGLEDAWECARQIYGMCYQKLNEVFPESTHDNIFVDYSATKAMQKIKEYDEKQSDDDEIGIGDEIRFLTSGTKAVIFDVGKDDELWILNEEGDASVVNPVDIVKTGKHIGSIAEILKQLRGENE